MRMEKREMTGEARVKCVTQEDRSGVPTSPPGMDCAMGCEFLSMAREVSGRLEGNGLASFVYFWDNRLSNLIKNASDHKCFVLWIFPPDFGIFTYMT